MPRAEDFDRAIVAIDDCCRLLSQISSRVEGDTAVARWIGPARAAFDREIGESTASIRVALVEMAAARSTALERAQACRTYLAEVDECRRARLAGVEVHEPIRPWFCDPVGLQ